MTVAMFFPGTTLWRGGNELPAAKVTQPTVRTNGGSVTGLLGVGQRWRVSPHFVPLRSAVRSQKLSLVQVWL